MKPAILSIINLLASGNAQENSNTPTKTNQVNQLSNEKSKTLKEEKEALWLKNFYGNASIGYTTEDVLKNEPGSDTMSGDSKYRVLADLAIGIRPIKFDNFFANIQYQYSQNWETDYNQIETFKKKWFSSPKTEYFIFPTNSLLRTHGLSSDLKYLKADFQLGLFSQLTMARIGSKYLGQKLEESETVAVSEKFVPYVSYKYKTFYRVELSSPFRTEVNREDKRLSNASYSWSGRGRGRLFSVQMRNAGYVPSIKSIFYLDLFKYEYRYASIYSDRVQTGVVGRVDFPIWKTIRAQPTLFYGKNKFIVERTRIPGFGKGAPLQNNNPPELKERIDNLVNIEINVNMLINKQMRIDASVAKNDVNSSIAEYNSSTTLFKLKFNYSYPNVEYVIKRIQRFQDGTYSEEF